MARGHWPKGKRRNPDVSPLIDEVNRFLRDHAKRGEISMRAIGRAIEVDSVTVSRWLSGEDHPSEDHARHLREWLDQKKAEVLTDTRRN